MLQRVQTCTPQMGPNLFSRLRAWHPFRIAVFFAAAGLLALYVYAGWIVLRHGASQHDFGWTQTRAGGWYVSSVDPTGPAAGLLEPGDRLLAFDGDERVARHGALGSRRALPAGSTYRLRIGRHDATYEVELRSRVRSSAAERIEVVSLLLVSLLWCAVGLFIGGARPDRPLARLGAIAGVASGLALFSIGMTGLRFLLTGFTVVPIALVALIMPFHLAIGCHFFYRFPENIPRGQLAAATVAIIYLSAVIEWLAYDAGPAIARLQGTTADYFFWLAPWRGWFNALTLPVRTAPVAMIVLLADSYRRAASADQRRRVRWLALGCIVGLAPLAVFELWKVGVNVFGDDALGLPSPYDFLLYLSSNVFTVVVPITIGYAVLKHRLFDIKVVLRRGLQYLLAKNALRLAIAVPILALAVSILSNRSLTIGEILSTSSGYAYWIVAGAVALYFRRPLRTTIDRRFFREEYDREKVLLGLLEDLDKLDSFPEISRLVSAQLEFALHPSCIYVWYRDRPHSELTLAYSSGAYARHITLPSGAVLIQTADRAGGLVDVHGPEAAALPHDERRWLEDSGIAVIVPVVGSDQRLVGLLMLGEKKSEQPYTPSDRTLLQAVARQMAVVRENLQLKERVGEGRRIQREVLARFQGQGLNLVKECPMCGACYDSTASVCAADAAELTLSLPVERTIDGKYRLERLIGKGGMGAVYEAADLRLDRRVAVKVLLGRMFGDQTALRRFEREARTAARLNHPAIVSVYDYGVLAAEGAYIVMERIPGITLRQELDRRGPIPPGIAAGWFERIIEGLKLAHANGVIHRDLKPENILIGASAEGGRVSVKILDFGLAKMRPLEMGDTHTLSVAGVVMGTFGYMSPEQLAGAEVDERTDIFALGVIVYETITGRRPFDGAGYSDVVRSVLHDIMRLPGHQSPPVGALDAVLQRCLAKDPKTRYASVAELEDDLLQALRACPPLPTTPAGPSTEGETRAAGSASF